jgi:hypothetical protein
LLEHHWLLPFDELAADACLSCPGFWLLELLLFLLHVCFQSLHSLLSLLLPLLLSCNLLLHLLTNGWILLLYSVWLGDLWRLADASLLRPDALLTFLPLFCLLLQIAPVRLSPRIVLIDPLLDLFVLFLLYLQNHAQQLGKPDFYLGFIRLLDDQHARSCCYVVLLSQNICFAKNLLYYLKSVLVLHKHAFGNFTFVFFGFAELDDQEVVLHFLNCLLEFLKRKALLPDRLDRNILGLLESQLRHRVDSHLLKIGRENGLELGYVLEVPLQTRGGHLPLRHVGRAYRARRDLLCVHETD